MTALKTAGKITLATALVVTLAGCGSMAAYEGAKEDTRRGGNIDQGMTAEAKRQQALAKEKEDIKDREIRVTRDRSKIEAQLASAQDQTKSLDTELASALDQRRITKAKYDEMKATQSSLNAELASLKLKNAADQRKPPDPKVEADKEKKLAELQAKQKKLEAELAQALKTK